MALPIKGFNGKSIGHSGLNLRDYGLFARKQEDKFCTAVCSITSTNLPRDLAGLDLGQIENVVDQCE